MLTLIETVDLFFLADAETHHRLDEEPEDQRHHQRVDRHRDDALELSHQERQTAAVEQAITGRGSGDLVDREEADAERAEHAVEEMHGHRADRVVDLQRVAQLHGA